MKMNKPYYVVAENSSGKAIMDAILEAYIYTKISLASKELKRCFDLDKNKKAVMYKVTFEKFAPVKD